METTSDTLRSINNKLTEMNNRLTDIQITEAINNEINTLKGQVAELQKKYKTHEAQLTDLNRELHDINKWRRAVEDKIGAIEV